MCLMVYSKFSRLLYLTTRSKYFSVIGEENLMAFIKR